MEEPTETAGREAARRWTLASAVLAAVALWLLWAAQGMASVCPAVYPAPASCAPDARFNPALFGTVFVGGIFTAILISAAMVIPDNRTQVLKPLVIALVLAAAVSVIATNSVSGVIF